MTGYWILDIILIIVGVLIWGKLLKNILKREKVNWERERRKEEKEEKEES